MKKIVFGGICAVVTFLISCGSTSQPVAASPKQATTDFIYEPDPSEAVSLALPERINRSYFGTVSPQILENVEIGSPDSLKTAINQLKNQSGETEKVLLYVTTSVLQIAWPNEAGQVSVAEVSVSNAYTGAIMSARDGIYDSSTGNTDFLTKVLPSLVLITSDTRSDYYEQAKSNLLSALQERSDSVLANYLLGVLYRRTENYSDAMDCFTKTASLAPNCYEASYALAQTTLQTGDAQAALEQSQQLLQSNSSDLNLLKLSAESAYAAGDLDAAEQYVARVLQQESGNAYYILFRAKILVQKGDYIKAASLLDVYARTDATSRDYLVLRAKVQKDWNRNNTAALTTIEQALQLYGDDTEIVLAAAELSSQTGMKVGEKDAAELARQILNKEPNNPAALQIQVAELVRTRDYTNAYKASSALMALDSVPADAMHTHISICLAAHRNDEAWRLASRLYNDSPNDEQALQSYIQVLVATGRTQEASRLIAQQLPAANARVKSFLYYERSFISQGEEAVLSDLRSSLTSNPRNKDALMRLYEIYYRKKEYRKAQYYLKQVVALSQNDEHLMTLDRELTNLLSR